MSERDRAQALMLNEHVSWQGTAVRLAEMVDKLSADLVEANQRAESMRLLLKQQIKQLKGDRSRLRTALARVQGERDAALAALRQVAEGVDGMTAEDIALDALSAAPDEQGEATRPVRYYCGCYIGPPLPPDGEAAECGWETVVHVNAEEYAEGIVPTIKCGGCGADLGVDNTSHDGFGAGSAAAATETRDGD